MVSGLIFPLFVTGESGRSNGGSDPDTQFESAALHQLMCEFVSQCGVPLLQPVHAQKANVSSGELAISVDGRLIFSQGYGTAYHSTASAEQGGTDLFKIANVSAILTGTAVETWFRDNKRPLGYRPFGKGGALEKWVSPDAKESPFSAREITVEELMQNTAGWDESICSGHDIAFDCGHQLTRDSKPEAAREALVRKVLQSPLKYKPGTHFEYSNFGYIVLGCLLEELAGTRYEDYVKQKLLSPAGIHDMNIGSPPEKAGSEEVSTTLAAAAVGWLASARDLVRFIDDFNGQLSMNRRVRGGAEQAVPRGNGVNIVYFGSLPGSTAVGRLNTTMFQGHRITWVALLNGRVVKDGDQDVLNRQLDDSVQTALKKFDSWPSGNLFESLPPAAIDPIADDRTQVTSSDLNLLEHDPFARFGRAFEYNFQRVQQPKILVVGTTAYPNPESYLNQHTIKFQFSELFPSPASLAAIVKTACSQTIDLSFNVCSSPNTFRWIAAGGAWWKRTLYGLNLALDLSERTPLQQSQIVTNPSFTNHYQLTGEVDFDPTQLFANGSNWKNASDAVRDTEFYLCAPGKQQADCIRELAAARLSTSATNIHSAWTSVLAAATPKVQYKKISQFDFLRAGGVLLSNPERALNSWTFSWDLKKAIVPTSARLDAATAITTQEGSSQASSSGGAATKLCVIVSGASRSFINVPQAFQAASCSDFADSQHAFYALGCVSPKGIVVGTDTAPREPLNRVPPGCGWTVLPNETSGSPP